MPPDLYNSDFPANAASPVSLSIEASIIEINRLKSQERMDIDPLRLNAAIDTLIRAARFRIERLPANDGYHEPFCCDVCNSVVSDDQPFCSTCGQALFWPQNN